MVDVPEGSTDYVSGAVSSFARAADGGLFVGSNWLAEYDGAGWRRIEVPGAMRVLSLAAGKGDRIWVTGEGAIGYLQRESTEDWTFVSLGTEARAAGASLEDMRFVQATGDGAMFASRSAVFRWNGRSFAAWSLPAPFRIYPFENNNQLYVYRWGEGLLQMDAAGPRLLLPEASLPAPGPIVGYFLQPEGDSIVIFSNEVYRLHGTQWVHLEPASAAIRGRQAFCACVASRGEIVIGTLYGGVALIRTSGAVIRVVDHRHGLGDDSINAVWGDTSGRIWLGTTTGFARLLRPESVTLYDQRASFDSGVVRKVERLGGQPIVLTSHRVSALQSHSPPVVEPVQPAKIGAYWTALRDGAVADGIFWAGGGGGLWGVTAEAATRLESAPREIYRIVPWEGEPGGLLALGDSDLLLRPTGGNWTAANLALPAGKTPLSAVRDRTGRLWVSNSAGEIATYLPQPSGGYRAGPRYAAGDGLPAGAARPIVYCLNGAVFVVLETGVLAFDPASGRFEPAPGLDDFVVQAATPPGSLPAYWAVRLRRLGAVAKRAIVRLERPAGGGPFRAVPVLAPGLDRIGDVASVSVTEDSGRRELWIGGVNALLRVGDPDSETARPPPAVAMRSVGVGSRRLNPAGAPPQISPGEGRLDFGFAPGGDSATDRGLLYETRLAGIESDWSVRPVARREFTGLAPGSYALQARAVDRFGRAGEALRYPFEILSPWYRTPLMIAAWTTLGLAAAAAGLRLRLRSLKARAERLDRIVRERTRELSLSNTAKSEFLENIGHEIHDPLQGIVSLVNLIDPARLSSPQREYAESLKECSRSLTLLFDDVVNFSKLEYGTIALHEHSFDLNELLDSVRVLFLGPAAERGNTITLRPAPSVAGIYRGDAEKIRTVLDNFLSNAIKYAPGTPIELAVSAMGEVGERVTLLFEVSDGGPGIPAEEQELVFRKFVRGSQAKKSGAPGTGIGLATCRALARLLGGSVGVESGQAQGSIFYLKVPVERGARNSEAPGGAADTREAVLVVEDQPFNRVALAGLLDHLGYRTETARDAAEATTVSARQTFRAILIDLELPGIKGIDLARSLRSGSLGPSCLIVGTSANSDAETAARALTAGMDAFLPKPLTEAALQAILSPGTRTPKDAEGPDWSALDLYARTVPGGWEEARRAYLEALRAELDLLDEALRTGDSQKLAAVAHRMNSHAMIIGAAPLGAAAARVERLARAGDPAAASNAAQIRTEADRLEDTLNSRPGPSAGSPG